MYLHAQTERVEHNQEEHEVLKVAGGDNVPDPVLVGIFGDVAPQRTSLQGILHTLTLRGAGAGEKTSIQFLSVLIYEQGRLPGSCPAHSLYTPAHPAPEK